MRIVLDGLPIRGQSLAIVVQHLLEGWDELDTGDELHLVTTDQAEVSPPASVRVHRAEVSGRRHLTGRLGAQNLVVPRVCRAVGADVMLGVLPTTVIAPLPCPRALIAYDLRHEQRPEQFSPAARVLRKASYDVGFRQADAIVCISDRTRQDLLHSRPWLGRRVVEVAHLGSDHAAAWPAPDGSVPATALAFGQYGNKNVHLVIDAWGELHQRATATPLTVVGLGDGPRQEAQERVDRLGLGDVVHLSPWLDDAAFQRRFAAASLVVFPSDFEGFGMPAVEAMRLGIPVVITPEKALLEVCAGHATVMDGWDAVALADAVERARERPAAEIEAARRHGEQFTWRRTAEHIRAALADAIESRESRRQR